MSIVKELIVKTISSTDANNFVRLHHYSKKVVPNSQLHFGVFHNDNIKGVLQFGPPMNKKATLPLVKNTTWNGALELNRMAFSESLPKNSESRCIGICLKLIKKHAPHVQWVLSFADGTQCGDGTIYRASNFYLTGIKKNAGLRMNKETGEIMHTISAHHLKMSKEFRSEWVALEGFQFRYMYFIDPACKANLKVPILPFSDIAKLGGKMYKGKKCTV